MKILIPARAGSKRIPKKNLIDLQGRPLISYVIETSLQLTDEVYVSTDSEEIQQVSENWGAKVIRRPSLLSTDTATTNSVVEHFLDTIEGGEFFACVQPTSPLLTSDYLKTGFANIADNKYDSIISATKNTNFFWTDAGDPINFEINRKPRTQEMDTWYAENGAFYLTTRNNFLKTKKLSNGRVGFVIMPQIKSFEIDTYEDLDLVEKMLLSLRRK